MDGILGVIYWPGILAAIFAAIAYWKDARFYSAVGDVCWLYCAAIAGTGVVNCVVLPCCFYNMHLKIGFSDQTLNSKTRAYCAFCTIYCYRPLHVSVFIHGEAAEAQKSFVVDLCKHSV